MVICHWSSVICHLRKASIRGHGGVSASDASRLGFARELGNTMLPVVPN